jgi:hypothetical protein
MGPKLSVSMRAVAVEIIRNSVRPELVEGLYVLPARLGEGRGFDKLSPTAGAGGAISSG